MRLFDACKILQERLGAESLKGPMRLAVKTVLEEIDRKLVFEEPPPQVSVDDLDKISPVEDEDDDGKTWPGGRIGALCDCLLFVASEYGQHNGGPDAFVWAAREEQRLLAAEIRRLRVVNADLARALMNQPKGGVQSSERAKALAAVGIANERDAP